MVYAMRYIRGEVSEFDVDVYDAPTVEDHKKEIMGIITKRQADACEDWKAFGESLSKEKIPDFSTEIHIKEYLDAPKDKKSETFLGRFFVGALAQKSMVTNRIFSSGSMLAGYSIDYKKGRIPGIKDFRMMAEAFKREGEEERNE